MAYNISIGGEKWGKVDKSTAKLQTFPTNLKLRRLYAMFCGEYSHNLDSKKRMSLPSRLREELGESVVMTKNVDRCVSLYPIERWNAFTAKLDTLPETETRMVKRFLYSAAFETTVDGQGRILISPGLCEYAGLTKSVKVIGVGDHIEIWDEESWAKESSSENTAEITDLLIKLGF